MCEDLLLSYRAQLKGYEICYNDEHKCVSELPNNLKAYLVQQRRWALGSGQVLRLLAAKIVKGNWSFSKKSDACLHLIGYGMSAVIAFTFLLIPLWILAQLKFQELGDFYQTFKIPFAVVDWVVWLTFLVGIFVLFASKRAHWQLDRTTAKRALYGLQVILFSPLFICLVSGSFWRGLFNKSKKDSPLLIFNRTPKNSAKSDRIDLKDNVTCSIFAAYCMMTAIFAFTSAYYYVSFIMLAYFGFIINFLVKEVYHSSNQTVNVLQTNNTSVSYTHLTLPTICSV